MSSVIDEYIRQLHSKDPEKKANAALRLGEMGEAAVPAVPVLVKLLCDRKLLLQLRVGKDKTGVVSTNVGMVAGDALAKIGKPAVEHLVQVARSHITLFSSEAAKILLRIDDDLRAYPELIETALEEMRWPTWAGAERK